MNHFATLSSQPASIVDSQEARRLLSQAGVEIGHDIDLDGARYGSIEDHGQTLVFTPLARQDRRLVVQLGPPSGHPRIRLVERAGAENWVDTFRHRAIVF